MQANIIWPVLVFWIPRYCAERCSTHSVYHYLQASKILYSICWRVHRTVINDFLRVWLFYCCRRFWHSHTLTGHFIRYTLLVLGWTPFCLQNYLNSSWHRFEKVLIASRVCCRFVGCTSMMQISRSTTSQRCSIGLRSGDCGSHLSKVNSLSCSRNQSEMNGSSWK